MTDIAAALAVDATFAAFGKAASYTPPGGGMSADCVVMQDRRDREPATGFGHPMMQGGVIEVRKSEIANPAAGGVFGPPTLPLVGRNELTESVTIEGDPISQDPERLVWICTVP